MRAQLQAVILTLCAAAVATSLLGYALTGFHPYTRLRDREIEQINQETDLSDLFAHSGTTQDSSPRSVESMNAIGLLPSGSGLASLSVATITGPALGIMGLVWWFGRRACAACTTGAGGTTARTRI